MKTIIAILLLILFSVEGASAKDVALESPDNFIRRLYKEHLSDYQHDEYWFDKKKKLSQYFDQNLTLLFLRDEKCKEKNHEICSLDSDPIIDAQDFDEKYPVNLKVETVRTAPRLRLKVIFTNIDTRIIFYDLQHTKAGWRVRDIIYPDGHSLKKLLSQPSE